MHVREPVSALHQSAVRFGANYSATTMLRICSMIEGRTPARLKSSTLANEPSALARGENSARRHLADAGQRFQISLRCRINIERRQRRRGCIRSGCLPGFTFRGNVNVHLVLRPPCAD